MKLLPLIVLAACTTTSNPSGPPCEMTDIACSAAEAPCTLAQAQADYALCPALVQFCGGTATVFDPDNGWSYVYGSDGDLVRVIGQSTPACATGPADFQPPLCDSAAFPTTACGSDTD